MIIGTAGHIDHGKTALVHALTGVDTDRLPEEKRRGITIELGFAPLTLDGVGTVGVVDVPGHEGFVRTMLAGATGIDVALLVIAADEGVMPQTREHLAIISLLGVHVGVVALTKRDAADDEWVSLVREDVTALLHDTPLRGAPIIETSAVTGLGIDALRTALRDQLLAIPARADDDLFRMPIDRAFTVKGTGTVVTGTVWSGSIGAQTPLRLFPMDQGVRARGLQSHGTQVETLQPGMRAAIALAAVDLAQVSRGGMLVEEAEWVASRVMRADVALLDAVARPLRPREWVRLHLGTSEVGARVVAAGGALTGGETRGARLVLDAPLVARAGDRFVLRLPSPPTTVGGGIIVDPSPAHRRARPWPVALTGEERLALIVRETGESGLSTTTLPVRLGVSRPVALRLVAQAHEIVERSGTLFDAHLVMEIAERLRMAVSKHHDENPLDEWISRAALRAAVPVNEGIWTVALEHAVERRALDLVGSSVRIAGWSPTMTEALLREREWLLERLRSAGSEPPATTELRGEREGNDPVPLLRNLERDHLVVQVEPDRFYAAATLQDMVERLRQGMVAGRVYGPAELREMIGTSRKYLIPFLEYCDRKRITERRLDGRVLGQ